MKKVLTTFTKPYFNEKLGKWVFDGYVFLSDTGVTIMFAQVFDHICGRTDFPEIKRHWNLWKVGTDESLEVITRNGLEGIDGRFMLGDTRKQDREKLGLTIPEVQQLVDYAIDRSLSADGAVEAFRQEIEPGLVRRVNALNENILRIETLSAEELAALAKELSSICANVKGYYPRSYENLIGHKLLVRDRYAQLKYPELYEELKKLQTEKGYKPTTPEDLAAGFSPRIALEGIFYKYFKSQDEGEQNSWELRSPFEKKFGESVLFHLEKV